MMFCFSLLKNILPEHLPLHQTHENNPTIQFSRSVPILLEDFYVQYHIQQYIFLLFHMLHRKTLHLLIVSVLHNIFCNFLQQNMYILLLHRISLEHLIFEIFL